MTTPSVAVWTPKSAAAGWMSGANTTLARFARNTIPHSDANSSRRDTSQQE
ncbi:MAG: hypothetical protein J07HX64_00419 [halophilic archaeon J07HX64]|nr:MAG: hypothetical protein J07HX64_00419 [halophilic archaeon J07HX64]